MTRAAIDASKCQGHGRCALEAPNLFDVDDFGKAVVLRSGDLTPEEATELRAAVIACPEGAVSSLSS